MPSSQLHTLYVLHPLITPSKVGLITTSHRGEAEAPKYGAPCLSHAAQEFRKLRWRPGPQPRSCLLLLPDEATVLSPPCPWSPCMPGSFLPHCSSSVFSPCAHHLTTSAQPSKPYLLHEAAPQPNDSPFHRTESTPSLDVLQRHLVSTHMRAQLTSVRASGPAVCSLM